MGCSPFTGRKLSSAYSYKVDSRNPDLSNFKIERMTPIDNMLIALINYPNCTNFEGRKILVFENMTPAELMVAGEIDPHFTVNSKLIARFKPGFMGWQIAHVFAKMCSANVEQSSE